MNFLLSIYSYNLDGPAANVTGSVDGISGNGCSGAGSGKRICANVGMNITISCAVSPGDTYTITGPGGVSSDNAPLRLTVADSNYGDFTCTSTNPCGSVTDTIRLERADCEFRLYIQLLVRYYHLFLFQVLCLM